MPESLKSAECLDTDQHDSNVISPAVISSDEAGQKMIKLEITHMMTRQRGSQKTQKLSQKVNKINDTSQGKKKKKLPFIKPRGNKTL